MCGFQKALFFTLLCIFLCKRSTFSCRKRYATRQWKFISASTTVGDHSGSISRCVFKAPKLKGRKKLIQAQDNSNLEKIKKLRNVVKEIKKDNIKEFYSEEKQKREKETTAWKVILYNDDIHNFTYVTDVIVKVIGQISKAKAHTITVEAHSTGQALILSTWRTQAEKYCEELQKNGLTVSIIHESQLKEKKKDSNAGS
ncbi:ATP-dependent Clp protease adaptor protein ClpS, putative [Plasmodium knowlesi strain H]|nr:ATP-dependent Clp protease adaptor protein ClpS, putative [Plasmodium knowlesi strain H]SBO21523.1 ATP-dependent Clp protease adaptor protein ClpS, putative [Plasmodium knowlesi strain H]